METGFAVTAVVALILNLSLPYDIEDDSAILAETDSREPTFAGRVADIENGAKDMPEVAVEKVMEVDV
jgi:hypothetical protein